MKNSEASTDSNLAEERRSLPYELAEVFATFPQVEGVALGGSTATSRADAESDLDLYIYSLEPVPLSFRSDLASQRATRYEVGNSFFEFGDEWDEKDTGIHVDVMYRDFTGTESQLDRVLVQHEASIGYTTCIWHNVLTCQTLFDRSGKLTALKDAASRQYPDQLARAIVAKNFPLLRDAFGAFGGQIIKAAQRDDIVSMNHRTAAFLGSYFDVLFAANHQPHPGEKRLFPTAISLPKVPVNMQGDVEDLLAATSKVQLLSTIDSLADNLNEVLVQQGLALRPFGSGTAPAQSA
jgi:predicted nucleotidyltransferase